MRAPFAIALILVVGFIERGAPGSRLSADQTSTMVAAAQCGDEHFPSAASPDPRATVVMCGLDNPRGLAFGPEGALYVAEAGRGGLGISTAPCFTGQASGTRCYAPTGAISRLWQGRQERVATGLPSHANLLGRQAIGPHDIAVIGLLYVTIGLQQPPEFREANLFLADFARVVQVLPTGDWRNVADLGTYETNADPDQVFYTPPKLDTNPYGLIAAPHGRSLLVTDAGGNSLLHIDANGDTSTYSVFKPHPEGSRDDSVPTSIAVGPDGAYYVGELTGFPLVPGASYIYRLAAAGQSPEVCLTGFTQIIDMAFDRQANLYVLQYGGTLRRVTPLSHAADSDAEPICARYAAGERQTIVSGLTNPTSIAVGPDGAFYVSNRGIFPGTGQVIRIER